MPQHNQKSTPKRENGVGWARSGGLEQFPKWTKTTENRPRPPARLHFFYFEVNFGCIGALRDCFKPFSIGFDDMLVIVRWEDLGPWKPGALYTLLYLTLFFICSYITYIWCIHNLCYFLEIIYFPKNEKKQRARKNRFICVRSFSFLYFWNWKVPENNVDYSNILWCFK